jgi:hypothetical protein
LIGKKAECSNFVKEMRSLPHGSESMRKGFASARLFYIGDFHNKMEFLKKIFLPEILKKFIFPFSQQFTQKMCYFAKKLA